MTDKVVAYKNELEAAQEVVSENEMQYGWEDWFGEEETVMRDVILATILMGLALKVEKKCSKRITKLIILINRRTAIAAAIIGLHIVFLRFKDFELYWGAVFF